MQPVNIWNTSLPRTSRRLLHNYLSYANSLASLSSSSNALTDSTDQENRIFIESGESGGSTEYDSSSNVMPLCIVERVSAQSNIAFTLSDFNDNNDSPDQTERQQHIILRANYHCRYSYKSQIQLQDYFESYTVAYNSPERAAQMTDRFAKIGLPLNVHTGVQMDDPRLSFAGDDISAKRLASVFYGHLDNIADFYDSGKPYGLFCEDDVHIHKNLGKELPIIIGEFNAMQLDILLLGYMTTKTVEWWQNEYQLVYDGRSAPYRYHRYPQDQWGIHLFMISRSYAKTLLETFGPDYAAKAYNNPNMTCCNPDWTLSKHTQNRALRYPMMAVEDGKGNYDHHGQGEFHRESHRKNYREGEFF